MKILAVDTSTTAGSVALLDDHGLLAERSLMAAQSHNRRLLQTIEALLGDADSSIEEVEAFAVTLGPGSFTGIRIGVSTMKTFAWVLDRPFVGLGTLDVLAAPFGFASFAVCALIDARKKEVYMGLFQPDGQGRCRRLSPYRVLAPERVAMEIQGPTIFCGDGWIAHRERLLHELNEWALEPGAAFHTPRAGMVAQLARERLRLGESDDVMESVPIYVRPSEAELNRSDAAANACSPST
jgi:tRNA threonylcarbamoyladenosine biosynthesis protein TsaB